MLSEVNKLKQHNKTILLYLQLKEYTYT